jgi:hypothetical protein
MVAVVTAIVFCGKFQVFDCRRRRVLNETMLYFVLLTIYPSSLGYIVFDTYMIFERLCPEEYIIASVEVRTKLVFYTFKLYLLFLLCSLFFFRSTAIHGYPQPLPLDIAYPERFQRVNWLYDLYMAAPAYVLLSSFFFGSNYATSRL